MPLVVSKPIKFISPAKCPYARRGKDCGQAHVLPVLWHLWWYYAFCAIGLGRNGKILLMYLPITLGSPPCWLFLLTVAYIIDPGVCGRLLCYHATHALMPLEKLQIDQRLLRRPLLRQLLPHIPPSAQQVRQSPPSLLYTGRYVPCNHFYLGEADLRVPKPLLANRSQC